MVDETRKRYWEWWSSDGFLEMTLDLGAVPTCDSTGYNILRSKNGKAAGEDKLPPELFKLARRQFQLHLAPISVKSSVRIEEPPLWKGASLFELFKGSGSRNQCPNSRAIALGCLAGKNHHKSLRAPLEKALTAFALDT